MDLVKKNLVSIIWGVIALLAVGALFWPVSGKFDELRTKATARREVFSSLSSLNSKTRNLPIVDINTSEPKKLNVYPTEPIIKAAGDVMAKVAEESQAIVAAAIKLNTRKPLVEGALPSPSSSVLAINFKNAYVKAFDFITEQNRAQSFPVRIMQAGFPPNDQQLGDARAKRTQEIRNQRLVMGPNGALNEAAVNAIVESELAKLTDELNTAVADQSKVYIDPGALEIYQPMSSTGVGGVPEPSTMFTAQVGLWIQEDLCDAIATVNRDAKNVRDAAIKHLIKLDIPDAPYAVTGNSPSPTPEGGVPAPAQATDLGTAPPKNFGVSMTGRVSNGVYDVFPCSMRLVVDATRIPYVLRELSRNRFVTVLNCNVQSTDEGAAKVEGYQYGDSPVVTLDVQLEVLMFRKWMEPYMPARVKQSLGIAPAEPAAVAAPQ